MSKVKKKIKTWRGANLENGITVTILTSKKNRKGVDPVSLENLEIRLAVQEAGLTFRLIAAQMDITPEYLSKVLRKPLKPEMKKRIVDAINVLRGEGVVR